jgi:hypothetical protein
MRDRINLPPTAIWNAKLKRDDLGKFQLSVKGRNDLLPVSSAFQHRFKTM